MSFFFPLNLMNCWNYGGRVPIPPTEALNMMPQPSEAVCCSRHGSAGCPWRFLDVSQFLYSGGWQVWYQYAQNTCTVANGGTVVKHINSSTSSNGLQWPTLASKCCMLLKSFPTNTAKSSPKKWGATPTVWYRFLSGKIHKITNNLRQ